MPWRFYSLMILAIFFGSGEILFAKEEAREQKERISYYLFDNEKVEFLLSSNINAQGIFEVKVDLIRLGRAFGGIHQTLIYGRDLDDNQKIDTWFLLTEKGVKAIYKEGKKANGADALFDVLKEEYANLDQTLFRSALISSMGYLLTAVHSVKKQENLFFLSWADLLEHDLRFKRLLHSGLIDREQMRIHADIQSYGYHALYKHMDQLATIDYPIKSLIDAGLWVSGSILFERAGKIFGWVFEKVGANELAQVLNRKLKQTIATYQTKILAYINPSKLKAGTQSAVLFVGGRALSYKESLQLTLSAYKTKGFLYGKLNLAKTKMIEFGKNAGSEWKYITLNSGVQLSAEALSHKDDIPGDNPLEYTQNLLMDRGVQQNLTFMASETILMTGITKNYKTMSAKFLVGGMIALVNSTQMNFFFRDLENPNRVILDTAWEVVIGNAQVQLDLFALRKFEELAKKNNNGKLKLVGYALALIDQTAGYYIYSRATENVENLELKLLPVWVKDS